MKHIAALLIFAGIAGLLIPSVVAGAFVNPFTFHTALEINRQAMLCVEISAPCFLALGFGLFFKMSRSAPVKKS